ncbi:MAG: FMN-binding negative transcriptional regulator [Gammaproteobacteria bacterium]
MYLPKHFEQRSSAAIGQLIAASPLATLVINTPEGLVANHLPFLLVGAPGPTGKLTAHIPRANPLAALPAVAHECLAIFHGPQGYISPSAYATKREHGRVVPTWNYAVVHVHGRLRVVDDPDFVAGQVRALTELHERPQAAPWAVEDAPAEFTARLSASLVGLEIRITRVVGKTKASQNQPPENQRSVLAMLDAEPDRAALATLMHEALDGER